MKSVNRDKAEKCLGGDGVFKQIAAHFLVEIDSMMMVVSEAIQSGDTDLIRAKAHWMKGGFAYLHADPSVQASKNLKTMAGEGPEQIAQAHTELKKEVNLLKRELTSLLAESD